MKYYKAEFEDEELEIMKCDNDTDAMTEAESYEEEHGILFNLYELNELNEDYEEIRTVY